MKKERKSNKLISIVVVIALLLSLFSGVTFNFATSTQTVFADTTEATETEYDSSQEEVDSGSAEDVDSGAVAKIDTAYYTTLEEAINSVVYGETTTIVMQSDYKLTQSITIKEGYNIEIDMAGYQIVYNPTTSTSVTNGFAIYNYGTLKIYNTSATDFEFYNDYTASVNQTIDAFANNKTANNSDLVVGNSSAYGLIYNTGDITLVDVTLYDENDKTSALTGDRLFSSVSGSVYLEDANFLAVSAASYGISPFYVESAETVTIDGGVFLSYNKDTSSSNSYALSVNGDNVTIEPDVVFGWRGGLATQSGNISVNGGDYYSYYYRTWYLSGDKDTVAVTVTGGTFNRLTQVAGYSMSDPGRVLYIANQNTNGDGGINAPASCVIEGGEFNGAIYLDYPLGIIEISGGTFASTALTGSGYNNIFYYLTEDANVTINGDSSVSDYYSIPAGSTITFEDDATFTNYGTLILNDNATITGDVTNNGTIYASSDAFDDATVATFVSSYSSFTAAVDNNKSYIIIADSFELEGNVTIPSGTSVIIDAGVILSTSDYTIYFGGDNQGSLTNIGIISIESQTAWDNMNPAGGNIEINCGIELTETFYVPAYSTFAVTNSGTLNIPDGIAVDVSAATCANYENNGWIAVSSAAALKTAVSAGGSIILVKDITIDSTITSLPYNTEVLIDGDDHTLTIEDCYAFFSDASSARYLTLQNMIIKCDEDYGLYYSKADEAVITLSDVEVSGGATVLYFTNYSGYASGDNTVLIENSKLSADTVIFFASSQVMDLKYNKVTIENSTLTAEETSVLTFGYWANNNTAEVINSELIANNDAVIFDFYNDVQYSGSYNNTITVDSSSTLTATTITQYNTSYSTNVVTIITYDSGLTFNTNGGTGNADTMNVTYDSEIGTLPVVTKTGCTFAGWYIGEDEIESTTIWSYTETQEAKAVWTQNEISIATMTSATYTGNAQEPTVSVTDETAEETLSLGTDYTVDWTYDATAESTFTNAGTYTLIVTGIGNYASAQTATDMYVIKAATVTGGDISTLFTAPSTGSTPDETIADQTEYTATISWSDSPTIFIGNTVYTATLELTAASNYTLESVASDAFTYNGANSVTYADGKVTIEFNVTSAATITSIAVTAEATDVDYVYGETFDATGLVVSATYNDGTTADIDSFVADTTPLSVGQTELTITLTSNSEITTIATINAVEKATATITVESNSITYDGSVVDDTDFTTSYTGDSATPAITYAYYSDAAATEELSTVPMDAGIYYVKVFAEATDNYAAAETSATEFTIAKVAISITATDKTSVYGENLATLEYAYVEGSNVLIGDDKITLTKADGTAVGSYAITASASNNYDLTVVEGTYTITSEVPTAPTLSGYTVIQNSTSVAALDGTTTVSDESGVISYQWYSYDDESDTVVTKIEDATSAKYTPEVTDAGTTYYYVVVTNTNYAADGTTVIDSEFVTSNKVAIVVIADEDITNGNASEVVYSFATGVTEEIESLKVVVDEEVDESDEEAAAAVVNSVLGNIINEISYIASEVATADDVETANDEIAELLAQAELISSAQTETIETVTVEDEAGEETSVKIATIEITETNVNDEEEEEVKTATVTVTVEKDSAATTVLVAEGVTTAQEETALENKPSADVEASFTIKVLNTGNEVINDEHDEEIAFSIETTVEYKSGYDYELYHDGTLVDDAVFSRSTDGFLIIDFTASSFSPFVVLSSVTQSSSNITIDSSYTVGGSSSSSSSTSTEVEAEEETEVETEVETPTATETPAATETPTATVAPTTESATSSSNAWIWIVLGVLVLGGIAGFVVYKKKNK